MNADLAQPIPAALLAACRDPDILAAVFEQPGSGLAYFPREDERAPWVSPRLLAALGAAAGPLRIGSLAPHPADQERVHALITTAPEGATTVPSLVLRWGDGSQQEDMRVLALTDVRLLFVHSEGRIVGALVLCEAIRAPSAPAPRNCNSEFHFRSLVESLPLLLWTCDVEGRCDYLSPQWVEYTGVSEAQLGAAWYEQIHPDDRALTQEKWQAATAAMVPFEAEYRIRDRLGSYSWFRARALPLFGQNGAILRWLGETSEFQAEHEKSERLIARLELASSISTHGIWDYDLITNQIHWDARMYELYGVFRPTFKPTLENWLARLHPEDRLRAPSSPLEAGEDAPPFDGEFRVQDARGSYRRLRAKTVVWRDGARPVRLLGVCFDVTAEHDTLQALLANQTLLDDFIWHAPAAIAMLDTEMRYLKTSEQWLREFKLDGQDIIGKSHYDVFPDIPEHWRLAYKRALAGAVDFAEEEAFPRANGKVEWLQWEIRPWRKADRSIGGLVFFTQVITARKELDLALEQQRQSLARSNRDLAEFAYAASHDLQEPLRAISGCAQLLQSRYGQGLDKESHVLIEHLVQGSERMRSLITDLLAYARLGSLAAVQAQVPLDEVVSEALENLRTSREEAEALVSIGPLPAVHGNRALLILLFQNLLSNAFKYRTREVQPEVFISAEALGDEIRVHVRDNGIGIPEQFQLRVFQLFQRLHTRNEYPGNGLGLTICSRIAEEHGGSIAVTSAPGKGSDFTLILPSPGSTL